MLTGIRGPDAKKTGTYAFPDYALKNPKNKGSVSFAAQKPGSIDLELADTGTAGNL